MAVISSPLAKSLQGGLIQRVSGSAFGGGRGIGPVSSGGVDSERSQELLEGNQATLTSISGSLSSISQEIGTLRSGIDSIAAKISSESKLEEAAARADAEYQKRVAERGIRSEGEQRLENKIQAALSAPVQAISNKVNSTFGRVGEAIRILLTGWGLQQLVKLVNAVANGDVDAIKEVGFNVLRTFGFLIAGNGALTIIKIGIGKIVGLLLSLASRVGGFVISGLFIKPFKKLIDAITNGWKNVKGTRPLTTSGPGAGAPPAGPKGGKGGKFGLLSLIGKTITGLSAGMNFLNGENVDAILGGMSIIPGKGALIKGIRTAASAIFTADEVLEVFGGNLTGKQKKELEDAKNAKPTTDAQTQPAAQPQTPLMGDNKKGEGEKGVEATPGSIKAGDVKEAPGSESGAAVPAGMEGTAATPAVTPQTPMTPDAASLSLGTGAQTPAATTEPQKPGTETPAKTEPTAAPAEIKPVTTQTADVKAGSIGPEPKPQTTVVATTPPAAPAPQASGGAGASTNVPRIRSSNPDNFYALYSQFNYNVVM